MVALAPLSSLQMHVPVPGISVVIGPLAAWQES